MLASRNLSLGLITINDGQLDDFTGFNGYHFGFVDEDGDGVNDHFADANGDGVNDLTGHGFMGGFMMSGSVGEDGTPGHDGWPSHRHGM